MPVRAGAGMMQPWLVTHVLERGASLYISFEGRLS